MMKRGMCSRKENGSSCTTTEKTLQNVEYYDMLIVWSRNKYSLSNGMVFDGIHSGEDGENIQLGKYTSIQHFPEDQRSSRYEKT
jgi:hypothetical protein